MTTAKTRHRTLALAPLLLALMTPSSLQAAVGNEPEDAYWHSLTALCGRAFEGQLIQAPRGDTSFEGKALIMHVRDCSDTRIRIPFVVGDDLSRTWVLTRHEDGRIELRHDHRHEDGTPDTVTQYGGFTPNPGNATDRIFPADQATWERLPSSHPNVWFMQVTPERFVYAVQRIGTERAYRVEFDLTQEVAAPAAPWGWED